MRRCRWDYILNLYVVMVLVDVKSCNACFIVLLARFLFYGPSIG